MSTFPLTTSPITPTYTPDELRGIEASRPGDVGTLQLVKDAANSEFGTSWFARWSVGQTMPSDRDWVLTPDLAEELTRDLHPSLWGELAKSESYTHALYIRESLRDVSESRDRLARSGVRGAALTFGAAFLDPTFLAGGALVEIATAGLGTAGVAAQVGAKASRVRSALRSGLLATVTDAPIEAFISSQDPDRGTRDVLFAIAGGGVLGGTLGGLFPRRLADAEARQAARMHRDLQAEEFGGIVSAMGAAGAGEFRRPLDKLTSILSEKGRSYFHEQVDPAARRERVDNLIDSVFGPEHDDIAMGLKSMEPDEVMTTMDQMQQAAYGTKGRRTKAFPSGEKVDDPETGESAAPPMDTAPVGPDDFDATPFIAGVERIDRVEAVPDPGGSFLRGVAGTVRSLPRQLREKRLTDVLRLPTFDTQLGAVKDSATRVFGAATVKANLLRRGDSPLHLAAEEWVHQKRRGMMAVYGRRTGQAFENFNANRLPENRLTRKQFNEMVTQSMRSTLKDPDPDIAASVATVRGIRDKTLQMAKDHRVKGFEEVEADPFKITRLWNTVAVRQADSQYTSDLFNRLVRKAILDETPELKPASWAPELDEVEMDWDGTISLIGETSISKTGKSKRTTKTIANQLNKRGARQSDGSAWDEDAVKDALAKNRNLNNIAKGFPESVRTLNTWSARAKAAMLSGDDADELAAMLRQWGMPDGDIEQVLYRVAPRPEDAGKINRAKHRLRLNENATIEAPDGTTISLQQFLESDMDAIMESNTREMFGAMASTEVYRAVGLHIDPSGALKIDSWRQLHDILGKRLEDAGHAPEEIDDILRVAEMADRFIKGQPLRDRVAGQRFFDRMRQIGFFNYSGGFGITQNVEWGNLIGEAGVRAMAIQMPALRSMFKKGADGLLDRRDFRIIEAMSGIASDSVNARYLDSFDYKTLETPTAHQADRNLRGVARLASYANGMIPTLVLQKRVAVAVATQTWLEIAKSSKIPNARRLATMGLSPDQARGIAEGVKRHAKTTQTMLGERFDELDLDAWLVRDPDTAAAYINSLDKWGSRVVQEGDLGSMMPWTTAPWGRVITQFKTFVMNAYEKQFLHRAQVHDFPAFVGAMWTTMLSGLVYVARTHIQAIGREDREEYLRERLTTANIAGGAGRYSGWMSLAPDIIDTMLPAKYQVFNRNSGLSADIFDIGMAPVPSLFGNAAKAAGAVATFPFDGEFTQREWRAVTKLAPFQTYFGVRNLLDAIGTRLPEDE